MGTLHVAIHDQQSGQIVPAMICITWLADNTWRVPPDGRFPARLYHQPGYHRGAVEGNRVRGGDAEQMVSRRPRPRGADGRRLPRGRERVVVEAEAQPVLFRQAGGTVLEGSGGVLRLETVYHHVAGGETAPLGDARDRISARFRRNYRRSRPGLRPRRAIGALGGYAAGGLVFGRSARPLPAGRAVAGRVHHDLGAGDGRAHDGRAGLRRPRSRVKSIQGRFGKEFALSAGRIHGCNPVRKIPARTSPNRAT